MVLPFEPLALSFHGVHYFIDTPSVIILHRLLSFYRSIFYGFKENVFSLVFKFFVTREREENT